MNAVNSRAGAITVDQLFSAAFSASRDPRSGEYMDGARAALAYRIEGARIGQPYQVGTASADAFASGIAEGHAIWRGASVQPVTADGDYMDGLRIIGHIAADIEAQAGDIEILLAALFDKLDALTELAPAASDAVAAINCFATCALRNTALIGEGPANIAALVAEGGAA